MRRFTGPLPFSIEPHRHEAGSQGFEPCRAALETACSHRSTLLQTMTTWHSGHASIQEGNMTHGRRFRLRVGNNLVPTREVDSFVIWMPYATFYVDDHVSAHHFPGQLPQVRLFV